MNGLWQAPLMMAAAMAAASILAVALATLVPPWRPGRAHPLVHFITAVLLASALKVLVSGREFGPSSELAAAAPAAVTPMAAWINRLSSLFLLGATFERLYRGLGSGGGAKAPRGLLTAFFVYWVAAVLLPTTLGAHPAITHEGLYTLMLGTGLCLLSASDSERSVVLARNGFLILALASLMFIVIRPGLVLDSFYTQGLIGRYPRLAGLTSHANVLGPFCVLGLLFLTARPFRHRWANGGAWLVLLSALAMSQSKTSWTSLLLCLVWLLAYRQWAAACRWLLQERNRAAAAALLALMALVVAAGAGIVWLADFSTSLDSFLTSSAGAQVATMTGRDLVWQLALKEWHASPWFGYGPGLFSEEHRRAVGMAFATHGHNQVFDTLARTGIVGLAGLALFTTTLFVHAAAAARRTGGLSVALVIVIVLLAIGEVPLSIVGFGPENLAMWLLMMVLCGFRHEPKAVPPAPVQQPCGASPPLATGSPG